MWSVGAPGVCGVWGRPVCVECIGAQCVECGGAWCVWSVGASGVCGCGVIHNIAHSVGLPIQTFDRGEYKSAVVTRLQECLLVQIAWQVCCYSVVSQCAKQLLVSVHSLTTLSKWPLNRTFVRS